MTGTLFTPPRFVPVDGSGRPRAAAKLYVYQAGTSTLANSYTTSALTTPNTNPIVASSSGQFGPIYLDPGAGHDYKFVLYTASNTLVWSEDNVSAGPADYWLGTASGTADILALTPTPALSAYVAGRSYRFITSAANTGAVTLAISGLTATPITKSGTTALAAGDLPSGAVVTVTYDGTRFQLGAAALAAVPTLAGNNTYTGTATFSGAATFSSTITSSGANAFSGTQTYTAATRGKRVALTYGTTVATDAALGNVFSLTVTDGVAFTISNPTNPADGQRITYLIRNTSGGAVGTITWGAAFKMASWTSPATAYSRSIDFLYDGTNWVELTRAAADIPN